MHLLSLTSPGVQMFDPDTATSIAITANDRLAEMVKKHPKRFTGLASFAPQDPKRAAKEIDRAMNQLKLNGLIVNSHTNGEYLDDRKYWPIFEAATASSSIAYSPMRLSCFSTSRNLHNPSTKNVIRPPLPASARR